MAAQEKHWRHAVAGSTAGMLSVLANHPLDVVKVRLQVQDGRNAALPMYAGFVDALRRIVYTEGVYGLYSGLTPNLVGATLSWGIYFYSYNQAKSRYQDQYGTKKLSAPLHLLSGLEAGAVVALVTNPIWVVKTRMALQQRTLSPQPTDVPAMSNKMPSTHYTSMFNALWRIASEEGLGGLYKGVAPSLLLVSHGALQFMTYEELKHRFASMRASCDPVSPTLAYPPAPAYSHERPGEDPGGRCADGDSKRTSTSRVAAHNNKADLVPLEHAAAAVISKVGASTITYPWQVVRSRQQQRMDSLDMVRQSQYQTMTTTSISILRNEGIRGFYKGLVPNTLRVLPASAITFVVYEAVNKFLSSTGSP